MPAGNFLTVSGGTIPSSLNPLSLRVCIASIFVIVVVLMAAVAFQMLTFPHEPSGA